MGDGWVHPSVTLAVSIHEAFVAIVVVLNPSSAWTLEHCLYLPLRCLKLAIVDVLALYHEALRLDLLHECLKVSSMVLMLRISSQEGEGCFLSVFCDFGSDKDVLEDPLGRYFGERDVVECALLCLH